MSNLDNDKQNIKISIIIASYNYEQYINVTLDSLVNQTYKNFEVIVVDDGSTDNSVDIIKQYTEKYSNFNLYQHANCSNRGLAETLKLGIQKASGEYIAFLESDDYWDKNYLQEKVEYIKNHKNVYLISNDIQCFGDINIESTLNYISSVRNYFHGNKEKKNHFDMLIKNNNLLPTFSSILIYKKILEKLDFNCPIPEWLDWWLWRQYALKYNIGFIDKKLTYWRKHGESYYYTSEGEFNAKCEKLAEESDKLLKRKYTAAYYKYHLTPCFESVLKNIFSVRNSDIHRVITILGIKFKLKSKKLLKKYSVDKNSFFEDIFSIKNKHKHKIITILRIKVKIKRSIFPRGSKSLVYKSKTHRKIRRLAIFASYSRDCVIHDHIIYYLQELNKICDGVIFVADNPTFKDEFLKIKDYILYAQFKRHEEYDFGSYKRGYQIAEKQGWINEAEELILCNDSVYGPIYPLENIFEDMSKKKCDFWGMIQNPNVKSHLQSWFLVFKRNVIQSSKIGDFLSRVQKEFSFWDVVTKYEVEFTKYLINAGFKASAYVDMNDEKLVSLCYKAGYNNVSMIMPLTLINDYKFPFAKVKLFINIPKGSIYEEQAKVLDSIKSKNPILYQYVEKHLNKYAKDKFLLERPLKNLILENDIISFDLFDTLLIRPYIRPTDLFKHMEIYYNVPGFAEERVKAEKRARIKNSNYEEITLDEIYDEIIPKFITLKEKELEFEFNTILRHPKNYEYYEFARENKKKIIITSDVYLPEKFLKELLYKNGYTDYQKLYVSSEYRKTKATGALYEQILEDNNLKNSVIVPILHIGGNDISDIINAQKYNFSTYKVQPYHNEFEKYGGNEKFIKFNRNQNNIQSSIITSLIAQHELFDFKNYWHEIGYAIAGPIAVGYVQYIIKESKLNNIDCLLFVTRGGYILQKVYQILADKLIENKCVQAQRMSNLRCFGYYGDDIQYLRMYNQLLHEEIPKINIFVDKNNIINEINKYSAEIEEWKRINRNEYEKHIKSLNIQGTRIASVDMTTCAYASSAFFQKVFKENFIFGFYNSAFKPHDSLKYLLYNKKFLTPECTPMINVLELLIAAPEKTINDIKNSELINYKDQENCEQKGMQYIQQIHNGILEFAQNYKDLFGEKQLYIQAEVSMKLLEYYTKYLNGFDEYEIKGLKYSSGVLNSSYYGLLKLLKS